MQDLNETKRKYLNELRQKASTYEGTNGFSNEEQREKALLSAKIDHLRTKDPRIQQGDALLQAYLSNHHTPPPSMEQAYDREDLIASYHELKTTHAFLKKVLHHQRDKVEHLQEFVEQQKEIKMGLEQMILQQEEVLRSNPSTSDRMVPIEDAATTKSRLEDDLMYVCHKIEEKLKIKDSSAHQGSQLYDTLRNLLREQFVMASTPSSPASHITPREYTDASLIHPEVIKLLDNCHMIETIDDGNLVRLINYTDQQED